MGQLITINDANYTQFLDHTDPDTGERKAKGLRPRNYATHPVGYLGRVAEPFALPIIPEADWPALIAKQEAEQSSLQHIRDKGNNGQPIPSYDQDGKGYCATADTEVLTENGWVAYPDYDWSAPLATVNPATHALEFQRPFERHVYEYDGPMIYSTNRRLDFGVTPDHQMYVRKWDERRRTLSDRYSFVRAGDLGWYAGFLHAPGGQIGTELVEVEVPGDRRYDGDDFLAMLGLIVSDGYAGGTENTRNWVSFASFRAEARPAVATLAARVGFHEAPGRPGVWVRYDAGALAAWLRENAYAGGLTGARAKRVPALVKWASVRQIKHFLHWFDDRSHGGQAAFWSTSRRLIDDLQELHLRIGKRSTIRTRGAKDTPFAGNAEVVIRSGPSFVLTVGDVDRLCIDRKKHIETERYKGLVYCAAVPNHTLLTRRNGSVLVSSNCWAHSSTSAVTLIRARENQPYVPLSAYMVACIIKGYRDEGGWGSESLEFIAKNGIPSAKFWPMQSMSRSNDNADMRANAALHKVTEWWDCAEDGRTRRLQVATALLMGLPVIADFNWWSHSVCLIRLLSPTKTRLWNSWGDSWSQNGVGDLDGSKAWPDSAWVPRVMTPAPT